MEQETPNESVRHLLMIIEFTVTKMFSQIVLMLIYLLACAPLFFVFLALGFKDEISLWIFWAAFFLDFLDAALLCFFSSWSNCASLRPWCWVAPSRRRYIVSLLPIAWISLVKTRWILLHLLPWSRYLVLSRHNYWHPWLLRGCGLP